MKIYKYTMAVNTKGVARIAMPMNHRIIKTVLTSVQGPLTVWAEVEDGGHVAPVTFQIVPTGEEVPPGSEYLCTEFEGMFVWHIYKL